MRIDIPDNLLMAAHFSESDLKIELAVICYQHKIFTLGQASSFAGVHQIKLQKILNERDIPLHYDVEDFREDLNTLNEP